ncbi:MAG: S24 family peptidase [Alphaproteobacteria bacterium]
MRRGLARPGRTQRGLALALGVDASAVSRLLHGQRRLRAHEIAVAARYLGLDPVGALAAPPPADAPAAPAPGWLPLLGVTAGSAPAVDPDLFLLNEAAPVDRVRRPDGLIARPRAFALQVIGGSMAPRYEPGDLVAVDPDQRAEIGSDVVVVLADAAADGAGEGRRRLLLKRLVRRGRATVVLAQFSPARDDIRLPAESVAALWPVLPLRAVLGL